MSTKKAIVIVVSSVCVLVLLSVLFVAVSIGGEASHAKDVLEAAVNKHTPVEEVQSKLASLGFTISPPTGSPELVGEGPHHTALLYHTWLTLSVGFDANALTKSYRMDRAASWF